MLKNGFKIIRKEVTKYNSPKYLNVQFYTKKGFIRVVHEFTIYTRNSKKNIYDLTTIWEDNSLRTHRVDYDVEAMCELEAESMTLTKTTVDTRVRPLFTATFTEYKED